MLLVYYTAVVCVLCTSSTYSQRVHFDCGAKVDVSDVKGLILSPGFPNNYSSGTHCVWQFFVPVGHQLTMEMFDFDVFRSPGRNPALSVDVHEEESSVEENPNGAPKERRFTQRTEEKQVVVQKDSGTMEPPENSVFISSSGDETTDLIPSTTSPEDHPENVCPDDVLYITDLIRFSLRFCGSERPSGGQLVFGSDVAMVEVVMELITSTHWGRGFALVFYYQNRTQEVAELGGRRSSGRSDGEVAALLAAVSIAALFGVAFVVVLCVILRSKMCTKGLNTASSVTSEVPVQNSEPSDGNELHLVAANRPDRGLDKNDNLTLSHTGSSVHHVCEISQNAQLDSSNGLLELELGTDEVFMISNVATPTVSSHMQHERFVRRGDMGSVQTAEWVPRSEPSDWRCRGGPAGSARPRAWSVRTFHDFLLPFPQLHRKWCSWNLTSPFSKLVDSSVSSGSVMDGGDHRNLLSGSSLIFCSLPQSHSARRQRRFNPSRFNSSSAASKHVSDPEGAPYGPEENVQICTDHEDVTVPVFGVSEDDDREPLVSAEQGNGVSTVDDAQVSEYFTHTGSVRSTSGVVDESKLDVLKTTSNAIHLPSLSHVTAACELVGKDM